MFFWAFISSNSIIVRTVQSINTSPAYFHLHNVQHLHEHLIPSSTPILFYALTRSYKFSTPCCLSHFTPYTSTVSDLPISLPELSAFISFCFLTHTEILHFHCFHNPLCLLHYHGVQILNTALHFWKSLPHDIRDFDCLFTFKFHPKMLTLEIR